MRDGSSCFVTTLACKGTSYDSEPSYHPGCHRSCNTYSRLRRVWTRLQCKKRPQVGTECRDGQLCLQQRGPRKILCHQEGRKGGAPSLPGYLSERKDSQ